MMPEEQHRATDDSFITVKREVPLWSILTALVGFVAMFVSLQIGQNDSSKRLTELGVQFQQFNANYQAETASKIEMKLKVERLEQRLTAIESRGKP